MKTVSLWTRFWARSFDFAVSALVAIALVFLTVMLGEAVYGKNWLNNVGTPIGDAYLAGAILIITLLIDAVIFSKFGNTPGKAIGGLRLTKTDGSQIKFTEYLIRNFKILFFGYGFGIPILTLIFLWKEKKSAEKSSTGTTWDISANTIVQSTDEKRFSTFILSGLTAVIVLSWAALFVLSYIASEEEEAELRRQAMEVASDDWQFGIRLDKASYGVNRVFTYHYSIDFENAEWRRDEISDMLQATKRSLIRDNCGPNREWFFHYNVPVESRFYDVATGSLVGFARVSVDDCV